MRKCMWVSGQRKMTSLSMKISVVAMSGKGENMGREGQSPGAGSAAAQATRLLLFVVE